MSFNSLEFLIFFPLVAVLFYALPHRLRAPFILIASCVFYAWTMPAYILIAFYAAGVSWVGGRAIAKASGGRRRAYTAVTALLVFAPLMLYKYFDFFMRLLSSALGTAGLEVALPQMGLLLPVGISFYTFQCAAYVFDMYRGKYEPEKNPMYYLLYIMFFPQLVAGPIERANNVLLQFRQRVEFDCDRVRSGLVQMLMGVFKKVVVADRLAKAVTHVYGNPDAFGGAALAIATLLFAVQIYCDFAGYSDIAIGCARILGIRLTKNFDAPLLARSPSDFWDRWHISLSTWLKDYIYIPLGGNRRGFARVCLNLLAVFAISGLWHGASLTFVAWWLLNGLYMIAERIFKKNRTGKKHKFALPAAVCRIMTFLAISFTWIFFRADSLDSAVRVIKGIFTRMNIGALPAAIMSLGLNKYDLLLSAAGIAAIFLLQLAELRGISDGGLAKKPFVLRYICYTAAVAVILFFGVYGSTEFIYFRF